MEVADGPWKGMYTVSVKEKSPVIVVTFKVARMSGFALKTTSAIFEVCEALKIRKFMFLVKSNIILHYKTVQNTHQVLNIYLHFLFTSNFW